MAGPNNHHGERSRRCKACIPCHERKVKCDAETVGLPCTRCVTSNVAGRCEFVPMPNRAASMLKRKRGRRATPNRPQAAPLDRNVVHGNAQLPSDSLVDDQHEPDNIHVRRLPIATNSGRPRDAVRRVSLPATSDASSVLEEDTQLEICRALSQWDNNSHETPVFSPGPARDRTQGQEIFEYYDRVSSMTILGEVLAGSHSNKLVKIVLRERDIDAPGPTLEPPMEHVDYLRERGAFVLPSRATCEAILGIYFERAYPYSPILDRRELMREFANGAVSSFLLQCIIAHVISYMPSELLLDMGYTDRPYAQRHVYEKAQLLYDLRAERSQLRLLQGSLLLGSLHFSVSIDKDYRYWHANAVRLATQMGLHRQQMTNQLPCLDRKLLRRIWWVIHDRDILLSISGLSNVRHLNDKHCDTTFIQASDLEEEDDFGGKVMPDWLPPITATQKAYFVQNAKLAKICESALVKDMRPCALLTVAAGASYIENFGVIGVTPSKSVRNSIQAQIVQWKRELPAEMSLDAVEEWSCDNVWILVLRAAAYRFQSIFHRASKKIDQANDDKDSARRTQQKQQDAMLGLDSTLDRIMLHNLVGCCPLSVLTAAATVIAMHIEVALDPETFETQRLTARVHTHNALSFIRAAAVFCESSRWTLRMFEAVIARTTLGLHGSPPDHGSHNKKAHTHPGPAQEGPSLSTNAAAAADESGPGMQQNHDASFFSPEDTSTLDAAGRNQEEWMNDIFGINFLEANDQPYSSDFTSTM